MANIFDERLGKQKANIFDERIKPKQRPDTGSAFRRGVSAAASGLAEGFGGPLGYGKVSREATEQYSRGREALLQSDAPLVGKQTREGLSKEGPDVPIIGKISPENMAKMAQGIGIDIAAFAGGDIAASTLPRVTSGALKGAGKTATGIGARAYNFLIKPNAQERAFGRSPGKALAKHIGPTANIENLADKTSAKTQQLLATLEKEAANSNTPVDVTPVFNVIRDEIKRMSKLPEVYSERITAHQALARDILRMASRGGRLEGNKITVNPTDAIQIKRTIGELPSWSPNEPKLGSISKVARKAYGSLDSEIDKAIPKTKQINEDVSNLIAAKKATERRAGAQQNLFGFGLMEMLPALTQFGSGLGRGEPFQGAIGPALVTAAALRTARTTPALSTAGSVAGKTGQALTGAGEAVGMAKIPSVIGSGINRLLGPKRQFKGQAKALPYEPTYRPGPTPKQGPVTPPAPTPHGQLPPARPNFEMLSPEADAAAKAEYERRIFDAYLDDVKSQKYLPTIGEMNRFDESRTGQAIKRLLSWKQNRANR